MLNIGYIEILSQIVMKFKACGFTCKLHNTTIYNVIIIIYYNII